MLYVVLLVSCPPSDTGLIRIHAHHTGNIEALNINIELCQWINKATVCYGQFMCFFFS